MAAPTVPREAGLGSAFASAQAFRDWYEVTLPRVYGYLLARRGGDSGLAEELTQLTYTAALRDWRSFEGRADSATWLCAIGRHKLTDHWRRLDREERRHGQLVVREIRMADHGARAWDASEEREGVAAALRRLPALQRAALVLRYMDGLSVREIAQELNRSESAAESLLARAREGFRQAYEEASNA